MSWEHLFSEVREYHPDQAELVLPTGGGVYLLTDEQDRMIQLASAADLRRAVLNRLTSPHEVQSTQAETSAENVLASATELATTPSISRRRADLSQIVRRIRWQPTHSVFEATFEYYRIARSVLTDTYLDKVAFGPAWFLHVNVDATTPRFTIGRWISAMPGKVLGPFATQSDANRYVQALEDVFDLCRYVNILEQAPHGQACAYFEMGRCPAPCNGSISMSQYRETIRTALRFAAGQREDCRNVWETQMREAAGCLEFEKAAALKQRIARARELDHAAYRFVRPIEDFSWLIVQRGGGRTKVKPFFVRSGWIEPGEIVRLKDLDQAVPAWIERMQQGWRPTDMAIHEQLSEHIWLTSHFLFRRERSGLFLGLSELAGAAELAEQVRQTFAVSKPGDNEGASNQVPT